MTVYKFNAAAFDLSPVPYIRKDIFRMVNGVPEYGYWYSDGSNEYKLTDGDYILLTSSTIGYISGASYASDYSVKQAVLTAIGNETQDAIGTAMKQSGLGLAQLVAILTKIQPVCIALLSGWVSESVAIANALTTDANFTPAVKTALLNILNAGAAKV